MDPTNVELNSSISGKKNACIHERENYQLAYMVEVLARDLNLCRWVRSNEIPNHRAIPMFS